MRPLLSCLIVFIMGCSPAPERVRLPLEGSQGKMIASFYAGLMKEGAAEELILEDSTGLSLRIGLLQNLSPRLASTLNEIRNGKDRLERDEWSQFIRAVVEQSSPFPRSLEELFPSGLPPAKEDSYFRLKVYGAMTTLLREVYVPKHALEDGLLKYWDRGGMLRYPAGTVIAAYHKNSSGATLEVTVKKRRGDGFWDFAVYDSSGSNVRQTVSPPIPYTAPMQCVGCHLGTKLYEPEESFLVGKEDAESELLLVDKRLRNEKLIRLLDEHNRRSDHVLGVYGTVYLAGILRVDSSQRTEVQQRIVTTFLNGSR